MGTQSIQSEMCPKSPLEDKGPHLFVVDKDDKNFKICQWCNQTFYRTDDEVLEGKL